MAKLALEELVKMILHAPGILFIIFIIAMFAVLFFSTAVSDEQKMVNDVISAMQTLEKPGDFTIVPLVLKDNCFLGFALDIEDKTPKLGVYSDVEQYLGGPEIEFATPDAEKKVNFPICKKEKLSKKPCVEGDQEIEIKGPGLTGSIFFYSESSHDIFRDVTRIEEVKTNKKAIELRVSKSGRILLLAPS